MTDASTTDTNTLAEIVQKAMGASIEQITRINNMPFVYPILRANHHLFGGVDCSIYSI